MNLGLGRSARAVAAAATIGAVGLLGGAVFADSSGGAPESGGDFHKGFFTLPLIRGPVIPFELTVMKTPHNCANHMSVTVKWDEEENWVKVHLTGKGVLDQFPVHHRTQGVDFTPNPFWPETKDVVNGRYQLWFVSPSELLTFYYDGATLDLLGSALDFPTPPAGSIPIPIPTLKAFPLPFFQPNAKGDVDETWTFDYDSCVRQDRPELGHHLATFPPHNLCFGHPFQYELSTTRGYISKPVPPSEAKAFSDYLRNGIVFDLTVEPPEYFSDPPYTTTIATYSNVTIFGGGIPNGWTWDIPAGFNNQAPPIRPWGGAGQCADWPEPPMGRTSTSVSGAREEVAMNHTTSKTLFIAIGLGASLAACSTGGDDDESVGTAQLPVKATNSGSYNLHLEESVRFNPIQPGSDPDHGRAAFGLASDLETSDPSQGLIEGPSGAFGGVVVSNGRTCFTCHRGASAQLGLPATPLSDTIPLSDPLFTGIDADAQGDPDGMDNLDMHALIKYRPGRFNFQRPESDPYRQVFFWRKSVKLVNTGMQHGFLNDGRARVMFETDRGAFFSHTQESDNRFDDIIPPETLNDMEAFQFGSATLSDPVLAALRDPSSPMFHTLVDDPFYTVPAVTQAQKKGKKVFQKQCMTCHNTPNVFNNVSNVEPIGNGERPPVFPCFGPNVGRNFNVGVSERNAHGLRFTHDNGDGTFSPIVIPLANENGTTNNLTVTFDIGLAATTGRSADVGRFKVPQLRRTKDLGPYFHDNSAPTLEAVIDYFNSPDYNNSKDGKLNPIHMNAQERADLLAFLMVL